MSSRRQFLVFAVLFNVFVFPSAFAERVTTYMHSDALGSVVAASNEAGEVVWRKQYQSFGQPLASTGDAQRISYTGKTYNSGTGLIYYGARHYDPYLGRFLSNDPVNALESFEENPMMFNRYAYANNNPYRYADPNGESPLDIAFLAVDTFNLVSAVIGGDSGAIRSAALDVGSSVIGVFSPVPGTGQAIKAARVAKNSGQVLDTVKVTKLVDPKTIRFTQNTVGNTINTPNGTRPLRKLVKDLVGGRTTADDLPPIRVFENNGVLTTLDNRRLKAFQVAGKPINTVPASAKEIAKDDFKFTSKNSGTSVKVRSGGL